MPQPILYVAITNHGFGHATRTAAIVAEVQRLNPDVLIFMVTTAPHWLLASYIPGHFIHRPRAFDVGILQSDSITMDKAATLEKLRHIRTQARSLIASEVTFLRQNRVGLVLADIPPLAAPIAQAADLPCWMVSNFGWDFIYRAWGGEFVEIADWIADCFGQCDRLFRLPFHEPMSAFPHITDVGLTGGSPCYPLDQVRSEFGLDRPPQQTALLTFGGLGLDAIPYHKLANFPDWQFITFDRQAPDLLNLVKVADRRYRPVDFMPLCDRVVSKPGFSTFAEACRQQIGIISITRSDFSEAALLLEGIQNYARHRILEPTEFFSGDWGFLTEPLQSPRLSQPIATNGNTTIAEAIVKQLQG